MECGGDNNPAAADLTGDRVMMILFGTKIRDFGGRKLVLLKIKSRSFRACLKFQPNNPSDYSKFVRF